MTRALILGAGLAGLTVARELATQAPGMAVTVVTQDDGHQYPKPQLSASLRLGKAPDDLIIQRAEAIAKRGIEVVARTRATAIDPDRRVVTLHDGRELAYDHLVLALGASPWVPPMAGAAGGHVLTVNHLDDYRRFRERLAPGRPVLIIGAGLIGIEFATDLTMAGYEVSVVDPGTSALPRLLPPGAAGMVVRALEQKGVRFHWQRQVASLDGAPGDFVATLSDGTVLQAGTVLSAVGLRPHVELARAAGLPTNRGVLVDAAMRVAPGIYAVGDCAELPGGVYLPFIRPIGDAAKHVARAIAGGTDGPMPLPNYAVTVKVPLWPVASTTPLPNEQGTWEEALTPDGSLSRLVGTDGTLLRVVATGDRAPELSRWLSEVPALGQLVHA